MNTQAAEDYANHMTGLGHANPLKTKPASKKTEEETDAYPENPEPEKEENNNQE